MSLELYAENNAGTIVHVPSRLRADSLEVTIQAAEGSVGSSVIELDDPTGDFYMRGLKPLYFIETDAQADDWNGIIGPFYAWNRQVSRGEFSRTSNSRVWRVNVNDINTLLTRRLQKGGDAERRAETDVERMDWLTNTAEVIGGGGDNGFSIEDFTYFFEDSPYPMDKTDYTGQDSTGVINDCLQDSGKNAFLFNSPTDDEPIRVGIWYGRTERSDFASAHRISNVLSDVNADPAEMPFTLTETEMLEGAWTFAPSVDAELDRDPSRIASGVMVQYDGGYRYETRPATAEAFERRDMLMQAELVKTGAQASRRALRYLRDLRNEDDAIECAVIVPSTLVHAFVPGHRVHVRFGHLPGYEDFVWMRVARVTYRQLSKDSLLYELALDLRAEEPPDAPTTGTGVITCPSPTGSQTFYPLGGSGDTPNDSNGNVFYWNPGLSLPVTVEEALALAGNQHWHFPQYGAGGAGTTDYAGDCTMSNLRILVVGDGTLTINTATFSGQSRTLRWKLFHHRYGTGDDGNSLSGVNVLDSTGTVSTGSSVVVPISTHSGQNCTHWVDVTDAGPVCGAKWGWSSAPWVAS
jgi:hypothetical protein